MNLELPEVQTGQIFNIFFLAENWIFKEQILIFFLLTYPKLRILFLKNVFIFSKGLLFDLLQLSFLWNKQRHFLIISFPDISSTYYTTQLLLKKWSLGNPASSPRYSNPALGPRPHKSFSQFNLLLGKVWSLWSCAHYFQWFTGYLNHVVLLISKVYVLK